MWPFKKKEKQIHTYYVFRPKEDITTFELARIVFLSLCKNTGTDRFIKYMEAEPESVTRHLEKREREI